MGFPGCCSEYFEKAFPVNYDPQWTELEGEVAGYPEANQLLKYFGARPHTCLTCSPTCVNAKRVGKDWFKIMAELDGETAVDLYHLLSQPITWSSYHGVVQVETPYFVGLTHSFPYLEKPRVILWKAR